MYILRNEKIRKDKNMILEVSYWKWILGNKNKTEIFQGNIHTLININDKYLCLSELSLTNIQFPKYYGSLFEKLLTI